MNTATLHYIYDPFCGWCYGAAPLLNVASALAGLKIELHGGGMMTGERRVQVNPQLRSYVMEHDATIARTTGQPFGDAYFNGLLLDQMAIFDSALPITAILAADALSGHGLILLKRIQYAHYVEGRRIADTSVLAELAAEIGLDVAAFEQAFDTLAGDAAQAHIAASRQLLHAVGGQGFPTLVLEIAGKLERLDIGPWLSKPQDFGHWFAERVPQTQGEPVPFCTIDGCSL